MTRILDVTLALLALLLLAPLLLPVMLLLKLTGEHHVFYLQERVGRDGEPLRVIKFATMLRDSPHLPGGYLTRKDDPRVLPVGRFLRKAKINELPQLVNVVLGHMSLVGPRPQARVHFDLYTPEQAAVIRAQLPGVTGLGSLVFRDEDALLERLGGDPDDAHDRVITPYKGELERWYADNRSVRLYLKVLALTAVSLARPGLDALRFFPNAPRPGRELGRAMRPRTPRPLVMAQESERSGGGGGFPSA